MEQPKQSDLYGKFDRVLDSIIPPVPQSTKKLKTYIDLFCGIGGFHIAAQSLNMKCVFASDIDVEARKAYSHNFNLHPLGDIRSISGNNIPDHDLLCAGFPCQPFSIIGSRKGFDDPRGGMFKEILRIIKAKRPEAVLLENVRQLATMRNGQVLESIKSDIKKQGYYIDAKILNALNFGLPQKRERILIVATRKSIGQFNWPDKKVAMKLLSKILEKKPDEKHYVSVRIKQSRKLAHKSDIKPAIWHENKGGNVSSHPYSCALRAGASYNYLLVDGERRLTPREMLRLQGFPESFEIVCTDSQTRKQVGNSVPVPMVKAVLEKLLYAYR